MRIVFLIVAIIFFATGVAFAQSDQNPPSEQKPKDLQVDSDSGNVAPFISGCEISELPWNKPPSVTLQQALTLAENYINLENIDISNYYLFLVKPNPYKNDGIWLFRWAKVKSRKKGDAYIEIVVSMAGKASQIKEQHNIQ